MEIIIGLIIIAIGSFGQSSSYVPINKVKDWSWESFWLVQGIFAWLVFPFLGAQLAISQWEQPLGTVECQRSCRGRYLRNLVGDRRVDLRVEHALFGGCARPEYRAWNVCRFRTLFPGSFGGTVCFMAMAWSC